MAEVIVMPRMTDSMEQGNIIVWHKNIGDQVESGDLLIEVETDKATMELNSFKEGFLLYKGIETGVISIGDILAIVGEKGEDISALIANKGAAPKQEEKVAQEAPVATVAASAETAVPKEASQDERIKASPLAKNIAKEQGIDLKGVTGTGENGRITKKDVEAASQTKASTITQPASVSSSANYSEVPVSQMRKVIAKRLSESKFTAPHFYLKMEVNMTKAIEIRQQINEVGTVKISFNDFIVKAVSVALTQHPAVNSSWLGDKIRFNNDVNIGVAVAIEDGLMVPVIRNANQKSLSFINQEVKQLAGKAKERKLQPEEMTGNTFTISNLGMFDIEEFTAIINPPDACILAVGAIIQKPIVKDGQIIVGNQMKLTLSCDHRVVDGATGAQFLQTVKEILENPLRLLV